MKSLNKNKKYVQGIYNPKNIKKYKGSLPIIYRSKMELFSFRYLDNSSNVISWGSESVIIPYQSPADGKVHRYFVDLVAEIKMKDNTTKKVLIEVKPEKQTKPPTISNRKSQKTMIYEKYNYAVNLSKWDAAQKWAKNKGYVFFILTEKHLNNNVF
jgi:hypothetical protein